MDQTLLQKDSEHPARAKTRPLLQRMPEPREGPPGTVELDPTVVRKDIMTALGLPPEAQAKRLGEIQATCEGSKLSLRMKKDLKDCPPPPGFTPEAAQTMGVLQPTMLDAQGRPVLPAALEGPGSSPEEPQRLEMHIERVQLVVMAPCACGIVMRTPDPACVNIAKAPGVEFALPPCRCGRHSVAFTKTKSQKRNGRRRH